MANTMLFGFEPYEWSNDACRGYIIMAMQDCGFSHKEIKRVLIQLYEVFDLNTLEQAKQKYLSGDYCPRARSARSAEKHERIWSEDHVLSCFPAGREGKLPAFHRKSERRDFVFPFIRENQPTFYITYKRCVISCLCRKR